jgi:hypothetical protein
MGVGFDLIISIGGFPLKAGLLRAVAVLLFIAGLSLAQTPTQTPAKKTLTPDEIIKAFADKETEFYDAWMQYTYVQVADIRVVSVDGQPLRRPERLTIESQVVFNDDGTREVRVTQRRGQLRTVGWTPEDGEVLNNLQPFALTAKDLSSYDLKYENRERVDELDCYVFSVKPKSTRGARTFQYFQGKIWVDDQDLQIVRTVGKPVPQQRDNQSPEFETIRQVIDEKYWFPTWTHADSNLRFPGQTVRIEETITYEGYKRFGSKATIEYGPPK